MAPLTFDYDEKVAQGLMSGHEAAAGGLVGYLDIHHTDIGPGTLTAEVAVRDEMRTPFGNLHGGVLSALCDHVLGTVCYPVIPHGHWAATTEFKINLVAPVVDGTCRATATIVSLTKRTAVVRIDVTNHDRLCAAAQGTVTIQAPRQCAAPTWTPPAALCVLGGCGLGGLRRLQREQQLLQVHLLRRRRLRQAADRAHSRALVAAVAVGAGARTEDGE